MKFLRYMSMCGIRDLFTNQTISRLAYAYFAKVWKNLASTKKHLPTDLLLSSVLCTGCQFLFKIPFCLPFSRSTVLTFHKEISTAALPFEQGYACRHNRVGKAEQFFTHTKLQQQWGGDGGWHYWTALSLQPCRKLLECFLKAAEQGLSPKTQPLLSWVLPYVELCISHPTFIWMHGGALKQSIHGSA